MVAPAARVCLLVCVVVLSFGHLSCAARAYNAIAVIGPGSITGTIRFQKGPNCTVHVSGNLSGLRPNGSFGLRVHEVGNLTDGCDSTGSHWNPTNVIHGGHGNEQMHAGDLGNVQSDRLGNVVVSVSNPVMSALGLAALYGRSIVLHNLTDDLDSGSNPGSRMDGNSGSGIACAVIGVDLVSSTDCPGWAAPDDPASMGTGIANFGGGRVTGIVQFRMLPNCSVQVVGTVSGLRPNALQASHIHAVGDLSGPCNNTGSHYNPANAMHGSGTDLMSHAGDMGNLRVDSQGLTSFNRIHPAMSQFGVSALYGLAMVIHNLTDDLGLGNNTASLSNGNAGTRIACAIIGRVPTVPASPPGVCQSSSSSSRLSSQGNVSLLLVAFAIVTMLLLPVTK